MTIYISQCLKTTKYHSPATRGFPQPPGLSQFGSFLLGQALHQIVHLQQPLKDLYICPWAGRAFFWMRCMDVASFMMKSSIISFLWIFRSLVQLTQHRFQLTKGLDTTRLLLNISMEVTSNAHVTNVWHCLDESQPNSKSLWMFSWYRNLIEGRMSKTMCDEMHRICPSYH